MIDANPVTCGIAIVVFVLITSLPFIIFFFLEERNIERSLFKRDQDNETKLGNIVWAMGQRSHTSTPLHSFLYQGFLPEDIVKVQDYIVSILHSERNSVKFRILYSLIGLELHEELEKKVRELGVDRDTDGKCSRKMSGLWQAGAVGVSGFGWPDLLSVLRRGQELELPMPEHLPEEPLRQHRLRRLAEGRVCRGQRDHEEDR